VPFAVARQITHGGTLAQDLKITFHHTNQATTLLSFVMFITIPGYKQVAVASSHFILMWQFPPA